MRHSSRRSALSFIPPWRAAAGASLLALAGLSCGGPEPGDPARTKGPSSFESTNVGGGGVSSGGFNSGGRDEDSVPGSTGAAPRPGQSGDPGGGLSRLIEEGDIVKVEAIASSSSTSTGACRSST